MKIGYMAVGSRGTTHHLTSTSRHPRGQLLQKCFMKHCDRMFSEDENGKAKHVGYVIGGEWFRIYEVHTWGKLITTL